MSTSTKPRTARQARAEQGVIDVRIVEILPPSEGESTHNGAGGGPPAPPAPPTTHGRPGPPDALLLTLAVVALMLLVISAERGARERAEA